MVSKVNGTVSKVLFYAYVQVLLLLSMFRYPTKLQNLVFKTRTLQYYQLPSKS